MNAQPNVFSVCQSPPLSALTFHRSLFSSIPDPLPALSLRTAIGVPPPLSLVSGAPTMSVLFNLRVSREVRIGTWGCVMAYTPEISLLTSSPTPASSPPQREGLAWHWRVHPLPSRYLAIHCTSLAKWCYGDPYFLTSLLRRFSYILFTHQSSDWTASELVPWGKKITGEIWYGPHVWEKNVMFVSLTQSWYLFYNQMTHRIPFCMFF